LTVLLPCTLAFDGNHARVTVRGEIDGAFRQDFADIIGRAITDPDATHVVVNLTLCTFIDCSGLRILVDATRTAADLGCYVSLMGVHGSVRRVMEVTNLDIELPSYDGRHDTFGPMRTGA
jgi:anti-sigma B factor antagonist